MFEGIEMAPPDAILGLTESFKKDPRPEKVNLGVGIYKDAQNNTPVFQSVKKAEERLIAEEKTKSYLPIPGDPAYGLAVREMVFGAEHEILGSKRAVTVHTPGGTAALRVGGDFIRRNLSCRRIWVSTPTWENHGAVFNAAGLDVGTYPYYNAADKVLAFDAMAGALERVPGGDVVLFHACCHNPTGIDPTVDQWRQLAVISQRAGFLPFFDFAYQGLGDGLKEDARGLQEFCRSGCEILVASSFSKNFGLYNERVGALTLVAGTADAAERAFSQLKICVRTNYSNPPNHGGAIVTTILRDAALRALWESEVREMCARINGMRTLFVDTLRRLGIKQDFSFIARQKGMFSYSGLTAEQVDALREQKALYIVRSGRINVAALTPDNIEPVCRAIASVL
ncbi:MAG: aspartate/tyrosine/aromatic aminotransferase [Candidatus Hydrogenedentes bacterium]|nr:aspartate/tyrosine/aromatic aminotransferase [Candidatus Hydrogenedentota bacterium]